MTKNPFKKIDEILGANGIILIVVAAVLLVVVYLVQSKYAYKEINEDLRLRAQSELSAKCLTIQNIMNVVETAVCNHTDDVVRCLNQPDAMYGIAAKIVGMNAVITGSSISFIEDYYPERGKWFEVYAVRDATGRIETMQLGSEKHDYFKREFFSLPVATGKGSWTNPYLDSDGAKMMLTTYSEPVYDRDGEIIAVLDADISLDWLDDVLTVEYAYPSSYHILLSKTGRLMSVPDRNFLLKTLPDMANAYGNEDFLKLNEGMLSGKSGQTVITDKKGNKFLAFFMPVDEDTGWSIAIINSEKEIFGDFHKMRATILWLSLAGLLILALIIARAIRNIRKLEKVSAERERIRSELQIASAIQMGMLPKGDSVEAAEEKIDVAAVLEPAKEVGGDLYDYFIKDDHLFFCIGDVSGKGVPASLFMAVARSLFRALASDTLAPGAIVSGMNHTLVEFNERDMFVTLFLGVLDLKTGRLDYCNAGHDAPVVLDVRGMTQLEVIPNLPLGVFPDFAFASQKTQLGEKTVMFLYTDGLTEAMDIHKEVFGEQRMLAALRAVCAGNPDTGPRDLIEGIGRHIKQFVGKAEQSDDITMLAFKCQRWAESIGKSMTLTNNVADIPRLNKFVEEACAGQNLGEGFISELKLAIEEVVANVIHYAYDKNEKGDIGVGLKFQAGEVSVEVKDAGKAFDPTEIKDADTDSSVEERRIGGLGLYLVRQLTDTMSYRREGNFNILSLTKRWGQSHI